MRLSLRSVVTALITVGLLFGMAPVALAATPTEGDIADAKQQEQQTQASIASLEVELANLSAVTAQANQRSKQAREAYDAAVNAAQNAQAEAKTAQDQAAVARIRVDEARQELAQIAQAMYQNSAGKLVDAYYFIDSGSFMEAAQHDRALNIVGDSIDQKVQEFRAVQDVATNLEKRAKSKEREAQQLLEEADVAADEAAQAAAQAQAQEAQTAAQRDALLDQLAQQKQTTKELEAQRFVALEQQQKAAAAMQGHAGGGVQTAPSPSISIDTSKPIADLSAWQSPSSINYDALAASVSGVILRIGYTGTLSGASLNRDSSFERHYAEFAKRGVPIGVYWYSCANAGSEGAAEARAALQFLGGRQLSLPIYIDVEDPTHQSGASKATLTQQSVQFASVINSAGYRSGIYASSSWFGTKLDYSQLINAGMSVWVAQWGLSAPSIAYDLWQYSATGRLNGYAGSVDVNRRK